MSLSFAVLIAELYDILPNVRGEVWAGTLLSTQNEQTGLFVDPLLSPSDLAVTSPGEEYVLHQTTYFALNALDALGCKPFHPLSFAKPFCDLPHLEAWLGGLDWSQPWRESNWVMFVASTLFVLWQNERDSDAYLALNHIMEWLDSTQEPETGFWGVQEGASLLDAMAGAYHFLPFYFCLGRPIQFPETMIESTLSLQQPDGLFHPDGGGDACLDVDAVDILVKCSMVTDHLASEVEAALQRAFQGILSNQSSDEGFCRARHRPYPPKRWKRRLAEPLGLDRLLRRPYELPRQIAYYSGWAMMPFDVRQSDLWSTWFRSFGLAIISARYPGKFALDVDWQFRRLPALGWHDQEAVAQCKRNGAR